MDSQPVIRVGNMDTTSNFEASGAALNITTSKVNSIGGYWWWLLVLFLFLRDDNLINVYVDSSYR